ncbi:hypothetical protein ACM792_19425, partial [Metapseudomonas otitidis]|uniref:hypothetical protein n=1 Tax=Metapseudomonas otitidis TaxID=319939 RepID=UPI0039FB9A7B
MLKRNFSKDATAFFLGIQAELSNPARTKPTPDTATREGNFGLLKQNTSPIKFLEAEIQHSTPLIGFTIHEHHFLPSMDKGWNSTVLLPPSPLPHLEILHRLHPHIAQRGGGLVLG